MLGKRTGAALLALAMSLSACGNDDKPSSAAAADGSELLTYVPADTPYFFGSLEPFPKDMIEKMKPMTESLLQSYSELLNGILESPDALEGDSAIARPFLELLADELGDDNEYIFGLGYDSTAVIYGHGLLPVLRATLSDPKHFDELLARMNAREDVEMKTAVADGIDYHYLGEDGARAIFARNDDELIVTVAPPGSDEALIATLLGSEKPAQNLGDTDRLATMQEKYGYLSSYLGYVDIVDIVKTFTDEPTGLNAKLFESLPEDRETLSDVCKAEISGLAMAMPELNFGYTAASGQKIDASFVLEMRDDLANGMKSLPAPVPGVGGDLGGLGYMTFGIDIGAARDFLGDRADAITSAPYECEELAGLNDMAAQIQASLGTPLPPFVNNFRGLALVVDRIGDFDIESGQPPTDIDARIVVALDDAPNMMMMGQMFVPQLAEIAMEPDGEARELPPGMIPGMTQPTFFALGDNALSLGIGAASESLIGDMLTAEAPANPPLQTIGYDYGAYMNLIGDSLAAADDDTPELEQSRQIMKELGDAMDRALFSIETTENGIEIDTTITLK